MLNVGEGELMSSVQIAAVSGKMKSLFLLLAAKVHLVCYASRGLVLVYRKMYQSRVFVPYLVHFAAIRGAVDRERAG